VPFIPSNHFNPAFFDLFHQPYSILFFSFHQTFQSSFFLICSIKPLQFNPQVLLPYYNVQKKIKDRPKELKATIRIKWEAFYFEMCLRHILKKFIVNLFQRVIMSKISKLGLMT